MVDKLIVVFFNVTRTCHLQHVVARVHQFAKTVERTNHFCNVGNDGFIAFFGHFGQEMVNDGRVNAELYLLRVYQNKL